MTYSPTRHVFHTEWTALCQSRRFRTHITTWADHSGGLLNGESAQQIVDIIQTHKAGADVAAWLLARADTDLLAARVLLQAMSRAVYGQVAKAIRHNSPTQRSEYEALCISAAGTAIAAKAGRIKPWPMWALHGAMVKELRSSARSERSQTPLSPELLDTRFAAPADCRAAVEVGALLKRAAADGTISVTNAQLVFLRSVCRVPHQQLAQDLGMSTGTVRRRHSRTIAQLRQSVAA